MQLQINIIKNTLKQLFLTFFSLRKLIGIIFSIMANQLSLKPIVVAPGL